jgi:hypothetical protein
MITTPEGNMVFNDIYELTYELISTEMGLNIMPDGEIFDPDPTDGNTFLSFNGLSIRASIDPKNIHYAGQGDIMLDLLTNVKMVTYLLGYYLNKKQSEEGMPFVSYFQEEKVDETTDIKYTALTIKYDSVHSTTSHYYHNRCLKFIDLIFTIEGDSVDLRNFDVIEEVPVKKPAPRRFRK